MDESLQGAVVDTIPLEVRGVEAGGKNLGDTIPLKTSGVEVTSKSSADTISKDSSVQFYSQEGDKAKGSSGQGDLGSEAMGEKQEISGKGLEKGTIRVKFNHEERDIDISEAASLAQQGLKLSSILPEYQRLKNNPVLGVSRELEEIAKARGMDVLEYIRQQKEELSGGNLHSWGSADISRELGEIAKARGMDVLEYIRQQKEELSGDSNGLGVSSDSSRDFEGISKVRGLDFGENVRQHDREFVGDGVCFGVDDYISKGYSKEDAFKLARVDKIIRDDELRQAQLEQTTRQEAEKEAENIRQISEFIEIYPEGDARFNEIVTNPDVALWLAKGYPLSAAYTLSISKAAMAVQKNEDNARRSSGSIEGNGSHIPSFSDDEIAAMSTSDIAKNFKQIMAVIKHRKK